MARMAQAMPMQTSRSCTACSCYSQHTAYEDVELNAASRRAAEGIRADVGRGGSVAALTLHFLLNLFNMQFSTKLSALSFGLVALLSLASTASAAAVSLASNHAGLVHPLTIHAL